jgi:hypothetical protein
MNGVSPPGPAKQTAGKSSTAGWYGCKIGKPDRQSFPAREAALASGQPPKERCLAAGDLFGKGCSRATGGTRRAPMAKSQTQLYLHGMTVIVVVLWLANIGLGFYEAQSTITEFALLNEQSYTSQVAHDNIWRVRYLAFARAGALLITLIFFCIWVFRANKNVRRQGAHGLQNTPGWAVGWYFVPIASYWKPYLAMKELWQASHKPRGWEEVTTYGPVTIWWIFWILSGATSYLLSRVMLNVTTLERVQELASVTLVHDALYVLADISTIYVVTGIYHAQMAVSMQMRKASRE